MLQQSSIPPSCSVQTNDSPLGSFVALPENRLALKGVERLLSEPDEWGAEAVNPLLVYGPSGAGKSHLVSGLLNEFSRRRPQLRQIRVDAAELLNRSLFDAESGYAGEDLLVVEDIHRAMEDSRFQRRVIELIDTGRGNGRQLVFTSVRSPRQLGGSVQPLGSRLMQGLAIHLAPLCPGSRQVLFEALVARRQLSIPEAVIHWLRDRLPASGREMTALVSKLEALFKAGDGRVSLDAVKQALSVSPPAGSHALAQIASRVAEYFDLPVRSLRGQGRSRRLILPRQVGMYIARKVTRLSLDKVGCYFGKRDHSTVLHACRRVQKEMKRDRGLANAIRDLQSTSIS